MMSVSPHYNCSIRILTELKEIGTDTKMTLFMNKIYYMFIPHSSSPPTEAFSALREKCSVCVSKPWSQNRFKGGCFPSLISALPKGKLDPIHTFPHVQCMYWCPTTLFFFLSSTSCNVKQVQRASASINFLNKTPCTKRVRSHHSLSHLSKALMHFDFPAMVQVVRAHRTERGSFFIILPHWYSGRPYFSCDLSWPVHVVSEVWRISLDS